MSEGAAATTSNVTSGVAMREPPLAPSSTKKNIEDLSKEIDEQIRKTSKRKIDEVLSESKKPYDNTYKSGYSSDHSSKDESDADDERAKRKGKHTGTVGLSGSWKDNPNHRGGTDIPMSRQEAIDHKRSRYAGGGHHTYNHYYHVPFKDKERAKTYGFEWDNKVKKWYKNSKFSHHGNAFPDSPWEHSHTEENHAKRHYD